MKACKHDDIAIVCIDCFKEKIATLQKDNDTLNTDLKEAEGAVADLMVVNDSLKAELERRMVVGNKIHIRTRDRRLKLEAEVARLKTIIKVINGTPLEGRVTKTI